jgi:hypothetical protein
LLPKDIVLDSCIGVRNTNPYGYIQFNNEKRNSIERNHLEKSGELDKGVEIMFLRKLNSNIRLETLVEKWHYAQQIHMFYQLLEIYSLDNNQKRYRC